MASSQQFNLRWNNHTNNLIQVFLDHFEKEQMVDVTLSCQGKFLKGHKIVLGACSPYFQEIFDRHGSTQHPVIILNGLRFEEIRAIVEFMYRGEVKVCESDLESLLATAENLQIKGLSNVRATRQGSKSPTSNGLTASTVNLSSEPSTRSGTFPISLNTSTVSQANGRNGSTLHANSQASIQQENNNDVGGTPLHLRRKRAKTTSPHKDVKEMSPEIKDVHRTIPTGTTVSIEDDNSDDLPMTIKIDHPYIRDIDEEEEVEWTDSIPVKETTENCDGNPEAKAGHMSEPKEKIPRPPNAFMIFANEWRRKLASQNPNESNKEISVRLGIMWKNLSGESKEDYFAASRQANEDHKKKYPDYYYSPKEARMRKRWKLQQQHVTQLIHSGQYNPVHLVKVFIKDEDTEGGVGKKQKLHA